MAKSIFFCKYSQNQRHAPRPTRARVSVTAYRGIRVLRLMLRRFTRFQPARPSVVAC